MRQGFRPFCLTMRRKGLAGSAQVLSRSEWPRRVQEWILRESRFPGLAESKVPACGLTND